MLLNSKSIMLPLGSKPSSESPFHSAQKAKSSLTTAYLTMPSRLPAPLPGLLSCHSPPCSLDHTGCPSITQGMLSPQRHGRSSGFLCWNASSPLANSLIPSHVPSLHLNVVSLMRLTWPRHQKWQPHSNPTDGPHPALVAFLPVPLITY